MCVVVIIATLIVCDRVQSMSSYNGGNRYQETSNAYGDDNYNSGSNGYDDASSDDVYNGEERPKIKVNIGLHIPAMKIQMPKRLLPKITVRAKVRQPNRPSVMYVPEIQIDKTDNLPGPEGSKPAATEGYNSNNYGSSSGYNTNNNNNYANQQAADQISTLSYQDGGFADSNYATNNNYHTSSSPQPDYYRQSASNGAYQQLPQQQGSYQQKYSQDNQYSGMFTIWWRLLFILDVLQAVILIQWLTTNDYHENAFNRSFDSAELDPIN